MCPSPSAAPSAPERSVGCNRRVWCGFQQSWALGVVICSAVSNLVCRMRSGWWWPLPAPGAAEGLSCHSISRLGFSSLSAILLAPVWSCNGGQYCGRLHGSGWGVSGVVCGKPVSQPRGLNPPFLPSALPQRQTLVNGISAPHVEALLLVPAAPQPAQRLVFPLLDPRAVGTDL